MAYTAVAVRYSVAHLAGKPATARNSRTSRQPVQLLASLRRSEQGQRMASTAANVRVASITKRTLLSLGAALAVSVVHASNAEAAGPSLKKLGAGVSDAVKGAGEGLSDAGKVVERAAKDVIEKIGSPRLTCSDCEGVAKACADGGTVRLDCLAQKAFCDNNCNPNPISSKAKSSGGGGGGRSGAGLERLVEERVDDR